MLKPQLQVGAPVHAFQKLLVLPLPFDIDAGAQQLPRPFGALRHLLQPPLGRFHRPHRRIVAAHHELAKGLAAVEPRFAQHRHALVDDRLIGPGRAEAEGMRDRQAFQPGRDVQQVVQRFLRIPRLVRDRADEVRELRVKRVQPGPQLTRATKAQHGHGAIGLDLAQALDDAPDAALPGAGADEGREAHQPGGVDLEIARDDCGFVQHPGTGDAFGHEPVLDLGLDLIEVLGQRFHPDQDRRDHLAGRARHPVGRKDLGLGRVEGARAKAATKGRIGHEFCVAFPFQVIAPDPRGVMGGAFGRMNGAVAIQKRQKMIAIVCAVAVMRVDRLLDREINRVTGRVEVRKRPRMQLVHQRIAQGMVVDRGHIRLSA